MKKKKMKSFQLLIKPTSGDCNLRCTYCFYRRVEEIYGSEKHRMSEDVLKQLIRDFLSYNFPISVFVWQGGEPTLAGLDFFRLVVDLQKKYGRPGQVIGNGLQTNGLLIDEDWAQFLAKYKFLVGVSLDGPEEIHNYYRHSWQRVMSAIKILKKHQVAFNILTVVSEVNVRKPREIYRFFRKKGFSYLEFIPCLEWNPEKQKSRPYAIEPEEYGEFLCQVFDEWIQNDASQVSVRIFDDILSYYLGQNPASCNFRDKCDSYMVVEFNGDIYPCDFFVYPEWKLGNLMEQSLMDIASSDRRLKFANGKRRNRKCKYCKWLPLCHSGCQVGRLYPIKFRASSGVYANSNYTGNYLCPAYRKFFAYSKQRTCQLAKKFRGSLLSTQANVLEKFW